MINQILIICVGNICRSPMAEALFIQKLAEMASPISVSSAGLGALVNWPADPVAVELMHARGIDLSGHRARQASPGVLLAADLILTMSSGQQTEIESRIHTVRGRVHRLGKWSGYDIPDPYKRPKIAFEQSLILIEQGVVDWCEKLQG
jgi:protein-tyrosine phosphatase